LTPKKHSREKISMKAFYLFASLLINPFTVHPKTIKEKRKKIN
jgi:hypothetical protein